MSEMFEIFEIFEILEMFEMFEMSEILEMFELSETEMVRGRSQSGHGTVFSWGCVPDIFVGCV